MNDIQKELRTNRANFNIELLGINIGSEGANPLIFPGRNLPWMQDSSAPNANVQQRWQANYRDLIILDENNFPVAVYNLTAHPLSDANNRNTLKEMLLNAAKAIDGDADKLPDTWEGKFSRGNAVAPTFDLDIDGFNHFLEFAFGSIPSDASDKPTISFSLNNAGRGVLKFRFWPGDLVDYFVETSGDLKSWHFYPTESLFVVDRNLYDGTGYFERTWTLTASAYEEVLRFIRIRAVPKP